MFDDRDLGAEQDGVDRPAPVRGVVDVVRIDAHQRRARAGEVAGGVFGEEWVPLEVGARAPMPSRSASEVSGNSDKSFPCAKR